MANHSLPFLVEAIGSSSSDGVFLYHIREKSLAYVNAATSKMFDISHESFKLEPAFFINHIIAEDVGYLQDEYERLKKDGKVENVEFRSKWHDGSIQNLTISGYMVERKKYIFGILRNITASRQHENYIINYGAKKNTLLDMIAHNLSGPLSLSTNIIEALGHAIKEKDMENIEAHIRLISENTRHCVDIISEFLEEEHMVSEHVHVKANRFDVLEKLKAILERYEKASPSHKFHLRANEKAIYVNNDDVKFLQIVNNLVSNAIKWSPVGDAIDTIVELNENGFVYVNVQDSGIGIPDDLKSMIFQRYTGASRPGLRGEKSIGMGLYIVRKLAELMGGDVVFQSDEGKGSTFTLILPVEFDASKRSFRLQRESQRKR